LISPSGREELAAVLSRYDLGALKAAERIGQGFVNDNWALTADRGRFFLKRRHPDLQQPDIIRAQHDLMRLLWRAGFPAPRVIPTADGETFLVLAGQFYEIQEYICGEPYDHSQPAHLEEAARILARYHACVQGFSPKALRDLGDLYTPSLCRALLAALKKAWRLDDAPELRSLVRQLGIHIAELAGRFSKHGALPNLIIHGDYYADNLLFSGSRIIGVVDYDKARGQPRITELSEALIYFASPRPGHLKHLVYPGFLQWGPLVRFLWHYACLAALDKNEVRALPDYVRCIWLQMSLTRLREEGSRITMAQEALEEVLALADWARANARLMVQVARLIAVRRVS
jgi:Ser/Thr protein kinase RdoA (MazF antagonist)